MALEKHPKATLRYVGISDRELQEAFDRGCLSHVLVEVEARLYPVFFYDPCRLQQDLEESAKHGRPFIAESGMIVIPEITVDAMQLAVEQLVDEGLFRHVVAVSEEQLGSADPYSWPP